MFRGPGRALGNLRFDTLDGSLLLLDPGQASVDEDRNQHVASLLSLSLLYSTEGVSCRIAWSDPDDPPSWETSLDPRFLEALGERVGHRFPFLEELPVDPRQCWAGLYPETPDHHAIVGEPPEAPGFVQCAGFGGHGVMHAPAAGRAVAELLTLGRCTSFDLRPLRPSRFAEGDLVIEPAARARRNRAKVPAAPGRVSQSQHPGAMVASVLERDDLGAAARPRAGAGVGQMGLDGDTLTTVLDTIKSFAADRLPAERLLELDARDEFPADVVHAMCGDELGVATGVLATFLGSEPILVGGTPEQQKHWLTRIGEEGLLFAYGATEPEAGSDLGALRAKAVPVS